MSAVATERLTLKDVRLAAKAARGLRTGGWEGGNPEKPLIEPLQEMADDISRWFNPQQGWKLAEVRTSFASAQRIEESMSDESTAKLIATRAGKQRPDQFLAVFHFDAESPPLGKKLFSREVRLDFPRVFSADFIDRVDIQREPYDGADVHVEKIGSVYRLPRALDEASSPYYLVGATVSVNQRNIGQRFFGSSGDKLT